MERLRFLLLLLLLLLLLRIGILNISVDGVGYGGLFVMGTGGGVSHGRGHNYIRI